MVNTTLRAYLDELNLLLEQEALEEVIGHCRHILQHYPKNVETYRLLGRALLEKSRHEEAGDVFQRVLSALPDDFVSHLGLSSVAEEQNQTPTAIWHLERAYEQDPNNMALQGELKRLYEADGTAPERVHLTQGALIRIYAKGRLYDQANRELLAALAQQPNRLDLLLLQADVLWNSDHPVEAAEIGLRILGKLPDSIQANRLLASLWLKSGRPSEAEPFVARLEQLDPFLAWQIVHPDGKQVPTDAFQLSHLDWDARAAASLATDVPDWVNAITNVFQDPESVSLSGGVTNWLEEAAPAPAPEARSQSALPDWMDEPAPANDVPDWFKEPVAKDTESSAGSALPDWFEEAVNTSDEAASPAWAEKPDEQLPSGFTDLLMGKAENAPDVPRTPQTDASVPDWLSDVEPAQPAEPVDAMSWLVTGPLPPLEEATSAVPETPAEPAAPDADWLRDFAPAESAPAEPEPAPADMPDLDWLSSMASASPEAPAEPAAPDADWLRDFAPAESAPAEGEPAPADMSDLGWLSSIAPATPEAPAEPAAPDVDWLRDFAPAESAPAEGEPAPVDVADLDWLSSMTPSTPEAPAEPATPAEPVADWLSGLRPADTSNLPPQAEAEPAEVADLDWLSSMAPATPEAPAEPAAPAEPIGDWLSGLRPVDTSNLPPQAEAEAEPAPADMADLDWLSSMAPSTPEAPAEPAAPAEPIGDWLSGLRPADTSNLLPQAEAEGEPAPVEAADLDWLSSMAPSTPEAPAEPAAPAEPGLDWLNSLQPADEASSEPAQVDNLDWLSTMSSGEIPAQPESSDLFEVNTESPEPVPGEWVSNTVEFGEDTGIVTEGDPMAWLRPYTETADGEIQAGEPDSASGELSVDSELAAEEPTIKDDAPAWLSSMMPSTPPGPSSSPLPLDDLDFGTLEPPPQASQAQPDLSSTPEPAEENWLSTIAETPAVPDSPSALDWLAESQEPVDEHPLELEDDWLASFEIGSQPPADEHPEAASEPAAPSADWLGALSLNQPGPNEPMPQSTDWLGSLADEPDTSRPEVSTEPQASAESSTVDDWMAGLNMSEPAPADETPGWMNENEPAAETAEPEQPDWLATPEAKDHFDNLIKRATEKANEPRVLGDTGVLGSDMPDWLSAFGDNAGAPEPPVEAAEKTEESRFAPDWLSSDMSLESLPTSSPTELPPTDEETVAPGTVPDWLTAIAPAEKPPATPVSLENIDFGSLDTGPSQAASEDTFDWLSTPSTQSTEPEASEEPAELALPANLGNTNVSIPAEEARYAFQRPPAWLRKKKTGQSSQDWSENTGSQPDANDLPDWLRK